MAAKSDRPELTAYLFGELEEDEKTQIQTEIDRSSKTKAEFEDLRTMSDFIAREFKFKENLELTPEQRHAILSSHAPQAKIFDHLPRPVQRVSEPPSENLTEPAQNLTWERIELLVIFLCFIGITFLVPRLTFVCTAVQRWRARTQGDDPEAPSLEVDDLGTPACFSHWMDPTNFKAIYFSAFVAIAYYAWIKIGFYPKRGLPFRHGLTAFTIYFLCHVLIVKWLGSPN